jgi:hypothetical protein
MKRPLRLVVGGGLATTFPALRAEDISLNVARTARPHVLVDIASAPLQADQFRTVYCERVPFPAFTGSNSGALSESTRILCPGGRLVIETGSAAPRNEIVALLRTMGFTNIRVTGRHVLRVTAAGQALSVQALRQAGLSEAAAQRTVVIEFGTDACVFDAIVPAGLVIHGTWKPLAALDESFL